MTINSNNANLLTTGQVAKLLYIHPNTVRRWSNKGILISYRIAKRGDRRFRREDVALLFESWLLDYSKMNVSSKDELSIYT